MDQNAMTNVAQSDNLHTIKCIGNSFGKTRIKFNVFTYTWVIENFIHCKNHKTGTRISSPSFNVSNNKDAYTLKLRAYPTGYTTANNLSLYLQQIVTPLKDDQQTNVSVKLSILDNTGMELIGSELTNSINKDTVWIYSSPNFAPAEDVFNRFLNNGNLTLKCTIRFDNGQDQCKSYEDTEDILMTSKMSVIKDLGTLMESPKFHDVVLVVGDKKFQAHKAVLAARSPVFSAILGSPMKEGEDYVVEVGEIEPEIIAELLRFLYTGQVNNIDKIAANLLIAAEMYHLDILKTMCEKALVKTLSLENLADILRIVDRHSTCHHLRKSTLEFLACNGKEAVDLENFDKIMGQLSPPLLVQVSKAALKKF